MKHLADSNNWPGLTRNWPVESMVLLPCGPPHSMAFPAKMAPGSRNTPRDPPLKPLQGMKRTPASKMTHSIHTAWKLLPRLKHAQRLKLKRNPEESLSTSQPIDRPTQGINKPISLPLNEPLLIFVSLPLMTLALFFALYFCRVPPQKGPLNLKRRH